jgi:hypothetical protein
MGARRRKLFVHVDESGQDDTSHFFIVVAVVTADALASVRERLVEVEDIARTSGLKWHKTSRIRRLRYLTLVLERKIAAGWVYVGHYKKPIPFFFPMIFVVGKAIKDAAQGEYQARVFVDGIDQQKAKELTNALRASGISLRMVQGKRDESEPLIRLADMWAGCVRGALLGDPDSKGIILRAEQEGYFKEA